MLLLELKIPFAAFRTFTAGWYRPTAAFVTPSAAYGLLLNVAAVESRLYEHDPLHDGRVPASLTRPDLPVCRLALGIPDGSPPPRIQSLFQQLHNYPVGAQAGMPPEVAKGRKNNITPIRREVLVDVHALLAVDEVSDTGLEARVAGGLVGAFSSERYGLPFAGDNNFLIDRIRIIDQAPPVRWYERVASSDKQGPRPGVTRLTTHIDRADMSRTRSALYAPSTVPTVQPPESAWTQVGSTV